MDKKEKRKKQIIETALQVWGDDFFYNTSLSSLANALGVSKTSLYRYFKNKEELLEALKHSFVSAYQAALEDADPLPQYNLRTVLKRHITYSVGFMSSHYHYYRFLVSHLFRRTQESQDLLNKVKETSTPLLNSELLHQCGVKQDDIKASLDYISAVSAFFLNQRLFSKQVYNTTEQEQLKKNLLFVLENGIDDGRKNIVPIDFNKVETLSMIGVEDIAPYNRVFSAVAEVIAEKGIWETTVESIAERLSMRKSSLYFYFKNREEMITEVVHREIEQLRTLIEERVRQFRNYREQLYAVFFVTWMYFDLKPSIFSIMNWLQVQFVNKPVVFPEKPLFPKYTEYITLLTNSTEFNPLKFPPELVAQGMNSILLQKLWNCRGKSVTKKEKIKELRTIYSLVLHGLKGSIT